MPVRHLSYTRTGKYLQKKPCVLMEGEQHGSNSTQSNDCILLNKIQIYKKMRIKTFFKTLIPLKTLLVFLIAALSSFSSWSQTGLCGTDEYMQALFEIDEHYEAAFLQANQQITGAINQNPNIGEHGFEIPVVVHIIHDGTDEVVSDQQVLDAIEQLNTQFAGGGNHPTFNADTGIRFQLATTDPNCNLTNGIIRINTSNSSGNSSIPGNDIAMKDQSRWPVENYFNIWVVDDIRTLVQNQQTGVITEVIDFIAGYAPIGFIPGGEDRDGVVVADDRFGETGAAINNTANTLTHEVGHYLSLLHPWGIGDGNNCNRCNELDCDAFGDLVCDTNPCPGPLFMNECDIENTCVDLCSINVNLPYPKESYMSFETVCYTGFSVGQAIHMCAEIEVFRQELVSPENAALTGIIPVQQDVTIPQNTTQTWSVPPNAVEDYIRIDGNLTIEPGATLQVNPGVIVMFSPESTVIVEPNARLIMNGSTFTSCDTWEGIQALGNTNQPQSLSQQSYVYMRDATIEHAYVGIYTGERTPVTFSPTAGTTGAYIRTLSSTFRDNFIDVAFWDYANINPFSGLEGNNRSNFTLCHSLLTDEYRFAPDKLEAFISMTGVNGIAIRGHHFEDQRAIIDVDRPSDKIGIQSVLSGFIVDELCSGPPSLPIPPTCNGNRTSFVNLGYGIHSGSSINPSFNIRVRNSDFDCWHGVYTRAVDNLAIELNSFNVKRQEIPELPGNLPDWNVVPSYGIHLDNCTQYTVQENDLVSEEQLGSPTTGDETAGIVVRNNHGGSEQIYNNDFDSFNVACEGIAQNRSGGNPSEEVGLQFRCNDFTDGRVDIFVSPEVNPNLIPNPPTTINGILPTQNLPANLFSPANPVLLTHIWNLSGAAPMTYIHHNPANEPRVVPDELIMFNNDVTAIPDIFEAYNDITTCPDLLSNGSGMGIDDGIITLTGIKNVKNNLIQTELSTLQTLTDNGNTPLLLAAVNHPNPQRSFQAYTNILSQAPFTSDEVLEAVSKKESGWSIGMVRNVLSAHPQAAKSTIIQENLDNRSHRLYPFMRNQINEGFAVISEKEQMELDISKYRRERNLAINQAVQLLASDTIDRTSDMIDFYSNTGDIQYEYRLAEVYDALASSKAENVLTAIGNMELSDNEAKAHADYMSFRQLMQTWTAEDKNLAALSESDLGLLEDYTKNATVTAGKAITLLELNGMNTYKEPVYFPSEMELEDRSIEVYEEEDISTNRLLIYPNPADEYVVIEYALTESSHDISLVVTNTKGQVIYNEQLGYVQDELIIITDKFPTGQYFCTIYNRGNILKTDKFLLVR